MQSLHSLINSTVLYWVNRVSMFNLLFDAASYTLLKFAKDDQYLGAQPGIIAVLHIPQSGTGSGGSS